MYKAERFYCNCVKEVSFFSDCRYSDLWRNLQGSFIFRESAKLFDNQFSSSMILVYTSKLHPLHWSFSPKLSLKRFLLFYYPL